MSFLPFIGLAAEKEPLLVGSVTQLGGRGGGGSGEVSFVGESYNLLEFRPQEVRRAQRPPDLWYVHTVLPARPSNGVHERVTVCLLSVCYQ